MDLKKNWELVKSAASSWIDDYAPSMGAALAYYTVFSIAPLLLIVISIAGLVFGEEAARGEIVSPAAGPDGGRCGARPSRVCSSPSTSRARASSQPCSASSCC